MSREGWQGRYDPVYYVVVEKQWAHSESLLVASYGDQYTSPLHGLL